jgi:2-polyprenyl-3-methyl-5-hydroxy-6-metoxy-1,4-benzoquinol methylase
MPGDPSLTPQAQTNRELWDEQSDAYQERHGEQLAKSKGAAWGLWQIHESELKVLGEVTDRDVLELGCGAAQWSIALHALGARVTGLDNSSRQLEHAREPRPTSRSSMRARKLPAWPPRASTSSSATSGA